MCTNSRHRQRGVTLVELVIAMVIVSVAVGGIVLAFVQSVRSSADPAIDAQALAIAEAYMDEILAKPVAGTSGCSAGLPDRTSCAVVSDYHLLDQKPPRDQFGNPITDLDGYRVTVTVAPETLNGTVLSSVQVTVVRGTRTITLRSHKVDY